MVFGIFRTNSSCFSTFRQNCRKYGLIFNLSRFAIFNVWHFNKNDMNTCDDIFSEIPKKEKKRKSCYKYCDRIWQTLFVSSWSWSHTRRIQFQEKIKIKNNKTRFASEYCFINFLQNNFVPKERLNNIWKSRDREINIITCSLFNFQYSRYWISQKE